jgi:hypothetical protein
VGASGQVLFGPECSLSFPLLSLDKLVLHAVRSDHDTPAKASGRVPGRTLAHHPGGERTIAVLTKKYVFRPAWLLFAGPGLVCAMLLAAGVILLADRGLIPASVALRLNLVPNLVLGAFCARWLAAGHVIVTPNQVVLHGWAKVIHSSGHTRRVYIRRHVPRTQWHTLQISGLLLATLTWTDHEETIVLRHLSQTYLLKHLLHARQRTCGSSTLTQRLYTHRARGLGLLRAFALLRILFHAGIALVRRLYPQAAPSLEQAARRCLRRARRLFCALRERPARVRHRTPQIEDLAQPGLERAWFARLLKDVETSTLTWQESARTPALARKAR